MGNLLFKREAGLPGFLKPSASPEGLHGHPGNGLVGEESFARILCLERKRAERSRKLLLLMLLDMRELSRRNGGTPTLQKIASAVSSITRETDVNGWYKKDCILGVLFTELGESNKSAVGATTLSRIRAALSLHLDPEQLKWIDISLNFFPEDWDLGDPGQKINGALYPEQFTNGRAKSLPQALKRAIDIVGSAAGLAILSPVFVLIGLLIKLTSKGGVVFRQKRVGQYGANFDMVKFRSMHAVNDPTIHKEYVRKLIAGEVDSNAGGQKKDQVFKLKEDPRITPLGKLLRKSSLDELPQLWNVLKGDMSLVGPRPPIPYELECYDIWHRRRLLEVKPGITGLWQVNGRSRTTFDEMVRLDLKYAKTWSLWLDVWILLKTPLAVLSGEGAL
ncbi:MAG: sugar transferase [Terriglobia bacterium]